MPYTLRAVLARCEVFAEPIPWIADSAVIPLAQDVCMVPLTTALCGQFGDAERPWLYEHHGEFTHLPEGLVPRLRELSRRGRVAYVEAEYHGGDGEQRSIVWEGGELRSEAEESSRAINSALVSLGVTRTDDADHFDTLGLGRHRSVDDWIASTRPAPPPPIEPAPVPAPPASEPPRRPWWRFWG
ncbi:MAG TPA: hypothetical protein VHG08_27610 [Longimicrobium sp.]|nr:hypothetical protein [Longimicrobium sp.]